MDFNQLVKEINGKLKNDNFVLAYAFNAVGKTRLSQALCNLRNNEEDIGVLCYNAFLEDGFTWDNENGIFNVQGTWLIEFIKERGIENDIIDIFKSTTGKKIEPRFNLYSEEKSVTFLIAGGNEDSSNIKISKGEETIFKWSLFYAVVKEAVDILLEGKDRSTSIFDNLKLIIIDDPVSSIDDYRIFNISCQIIELLREIRKHNEEDENKINLSFLISTHHALFYNIIFNALDNKRHNFKCVIEVNDNEYLLTQQANDSVVSYHGSVIKELKRAIEANVIQRNHFNLFRNLFNNLVQFSVFSYNILLTRSISNSLPISHVLIIS